MPIAANPSSNVVGQARKCFSASSHRLANEMDTVAYIVFLIVERPKTI